MDIQFRDGIVEGSSIETRSRWVRYDAIGDRINAVCSPLEKQFPQLNSGKMRDLGDIIFYSDDMAGGIYYLYALVGAGGEHAETMIDLIMNVIYPKTQKLNHFSVNFLLDFVNHCVVEKFSAQERKLAMERVLNGEDYKTIKFEKINSDETINIVNGVLEGVDLDTIRKKPALVNYYVGQVMKASKGKVNVAVVKQLIEERVNI